MKIKIVGKIVILLSMLIILAPIIVLIKISFEGKGIRHGS